MGHPKRDFCVSCNSVDQEGKGDQDQADRHKAACLEKIDGQPKQDVAELFSAVVRR
jgi:hypothetical protein